MKRIFLLPLLSLLLMACHSLPPLVPAEQAPLDMATVCAAAFPHHAWRMVHTITMGLPVCRAAWNRRSATGLLRLLRGR